MGRGGGGHVESKSEIEQKRGSVDLGSDLVSGGPLKSLADRTPGLTHSVRHMLARGSVERVPGANFLWTPSQAFKQTPAP